jgi:hypothetical protein
MRRRLIIRKDLEKQQLIPSQTLNREWLCEDVIRLSFFKFSKLHPLTVPAGHRAARDGLPAMHRSSCSYCSCRSFGRFAGCYRSEARGMTRYNSAPIVLATFAGTNLEFQTITDRSS